MKVQLAGFSFSQSSSDSFFLFSIIISLSKEERTREEESPTKLCVLLSLYVLVSREWNEQSQPANFRINSPFSSFCRTQVENSPCICGSKWGNRSGPNIHQLNSTLFRLWVGQETRNVYHSEKVVVVTTKSDSEWLKHHRSIVLAGVMSEVAIPNWYLALIHTVNRGFLSSPVCAHQVGKTDKTGVFINSAWKWTSHSP